MSELQYNDNDYHFIQRIYPNYNALLFKKQRKEDRINYGYYYTVLMTLFCCNIVDIKKFKILFRNITNVIR